MVGVGTGQVNLDFYGLALASPSFDRKVRYALTFTGAVAQANPQLEPKSPWALGLRYVYAEVDPQPRGAPASPGLVDRVRVTISAPTAILEFDSRDNVFTPTRGVYAESSLLASREALGASDNFERLQQVVSGWQPLPNGVTFGARADCARSSDGTPFFLRPPCSCAASRHCASRAPRWRPSRRRRAGSSPAAAAWWVSAGPARRERSGNPSTSSTTSAARASAVATNWPASSGCVPAWTWPTAQVPRLVYFEVGNAWFRP
jgi:hypothetical protein